jgi:hypothetical protein
MEDDPNLDERDAESTSATFARNFLPSKGFSSTEHSGGNSLM